MAIYHFTISNGSKSKGKVAATRAAYLTRTGAFADRDDLVFATSSNLPSWAESPEEFWSSADELERKNARVYREAEFALPRELDREDQVKLARDFARDFTAEHGLAYTLAIHDEDGHNPHAHLMWCDRQDDGFEREREQWFKRANKAEPAQGGAAKVSELNGPAWVHQVRADWELAANTALELAGERAQIDCRSYADQDKDKPEHARRIPQIHLGVTTKVMERKGVVTPRLERWKAIAAEREEQRKEIAARQAAARAAQQRGHMEPLRGRIKPARREHRAEEVRHDVAEGASPFDADTIESPPPAVASELATSDVRESSDNSGERAGSSKDIQDAIAEQRRCEDALFERMRAKRPSLSVRRPTLGEVVRGTWVDANRLTAGKVAYSFVRTDDGELVRFGVSAEEHERLRGRMVDVQLLKGNRLRLKSYRPPDEVDAQRDNVQTYLKRLAKESDDSRYNFRAVSHEGRWGGQISDRPPERVGDRMYMRLHKNWDVYLVPATKELEKRRGQRARLEIERQRNGELVVSSVEGVSLTRGAKKREKDRGFDR